MCKYILAIAIINLLIFKAYALLKNKLASLSSQARFLHCTGYGLLALSISLFPGGPGNLSTIKPLACIFLLISPFAQ